MTEYKKGSLENGPREFTFICRDEQDAQEWALYIQHLRTHALYEDFASNNSDVITSPRRILTPSMATGFSKKKGELSSRSKKQAFASGEWEEEEEDQNRYGSMAEKNAIFNQRISQEASILERNVLESQESSRRPRESIKTVTIQESDEIRVNSGRKGSSSARKRRKGVVKEFLEKGQLLLFSHAFAETIKPLQMKESFGVTPDLLSSRNLLRSEELNRPTVGVLKKSSPGKYYDEQQEEQARFSSRVESFGPASIYQSMETIHRRNNQNSFYEDRKQTNPERENLKRSNKKEVVSREIVEVVTKKKRGDVLNKEAFNQSFRKEQADLRFLDYRGERKPEKPNLYGKYQLVTTFFVDSHFDNSVLVSENNRISTIYDQRFHLTRKNIPQIQRDLSPSKRPNLLLLENSYVLEEESEERALALARGKLVKKSAPLESEQPINLADIKKARGSVSSPYYEREGKEMSIDSAWSPSPVAVKRPTDLSEWESMLNNPFTQQNQLLDVTREQKSPSEWESRLMERIKMKELERESRKTADESVKQTRNAPIMEVQRTYTEPVQLRQRNTNDNYSNLLFYVDFNNILFKSHDTRPFTKSFWGSRIWKENATKKQISCSKDCYHSNQNQLYWSSDPCSI